MNASNKFGQTSTIFEGDFITFSDSDTFEYALDWEEFTVFDGKMVLGNVHKKLNKHEKHRRRYLKFIRRINNLPVDNFSIKWHHYRIQR